MESTQKIQCPNCGATSGFIEKSPGHYQCAYCHSQFEHVSITPNASLDKSLYKQALNLINEYEAFEVTRAKYFERMFSGLFQIHTYLDQIERIDFKKNLFPPFQNLITREFQRLEEAGIQKNTTLEAVLQQGGKVVQLFYLKNYYKILAHQYSQTYDDSDQLNNALDYLGDAMHVEAPVPSDFYLELMQCKFGILQRIGKKAEAYDYLYEILRYPVIPEITEKEKVQEIREELKVRFESVLLSDDYNRYLEESKNKS
ncbi:MAG: hypothetical protein AAF090_13485 [Bacteroidota bacterium]